MAIENYDVIVIGAGPGGYVAALRCAQLGLTTACIDERNLDSNTPAPGGACLNVGCIPSKSLLESSHRFSQIKNDASDHGINIASVSMNIKQMMARKNKIIETLIQGIISLFKKNNVDFLHGHGQIKLKNADHYQVEVTQHIDGNQETSIIVAKHIIIATGSKPKVIASIAVDQQKIVDSTGALAFEQTPKRLGIIGAGVIGLELGSVWNRLGSEVIIFEALTSFLPAVDQHISKEAWKALAKQGLDIKLGAKITGTGSNKQEVIISYQDATGKQQINVDRLILAVGRTPNTAGLATKDCGLTLDNQGFIEVDEHCQTALTNVYAIGDVVRGPMLAHKASAEGVAVAERIAKQSATGQHYTNQQIIPWVIYTWPEIAWVGLHEQALQEKGTAYKVGTFPFTANSRARTMGETTGVVKILADSQNDTILGVHIVGPNASELIAEAVLAMAFDGSSQDLSETIHAHPSLSEALHEAALQLDDRAIHI